MAPANHSPSHDIVITRPHPHQARFNTRTLGWVTLRSNTILTPKLSYHVGQDRSYGPKEFALRSEYKSMKLKTKGVLSFNLLKVGL